MKLTINKELLFKRVLHNTCFSYFFYFFLWPVFQWPIIPYTLGVLIGSVINVILSIKVKKDE